MRMYAWEFLTEMVFDLNICCSGSVWPSRYFSKIGVVGQNSWNVDWVNDWVTEPWLKSRSESERLLHFVFLPLLVNKASCVTASRRFERSAKMLPRRSVRPRVRAFQLLLWAVKCLAYVCILTNSIFICVRMFELFVLLTTDWIAFVLRW